MAKCTLEKAATATISMGLDDLGMVVCFKLYTLATKVLDRFRDVIFEYIPDKFLANNGFMPNMNVAGLYIVKWSIRREIPPKPNEGLGYSKCMPRCRREH